MTDQPPALTGPLDGCMWWAGYQHEWHLVRVERLDYLHGVPLGESWTLPRHGRLTRIYRCRRCGRETTQEEQL